MFRSHLVDQELLMSETFLKINYKKKSLLVLFVRIIFLTCIYFIITL